MCLRTWSACSDFDYRTPLVKLSRWVCLKGSQTNGFPFGYTKKKVPSINRRTKAPLGGGGVSGPSLALITPCS